MRPQLVQQPTNRQAGYETQLLQAVKDRDFDAVVRVVAAAKRARVPLKGEAAIEEAIRSFAPDTLNYLLQNVTNPPPIRYLLATAAISRGRGQRYFLDYLFRLNPTLDDIQFAAETSAEYPENNAITLFLINRGLRKLGEILNSAISGNNRELVIQLLSHPLSKYELRSALQRAISLCRHRIVPLLLEKVDLSNQEYILLYLSAIQARQDQIARELLERQSYRFRGPYCDIIIQILQGYLSPESLDLLQEERLHTPERVSSFLPRIDTESPIMRVSGRSPEIPSELDQGPREELPRREISPQPGTPSFPQHQQSLRGPYIPRSQRFRRLTFGEGQPNEEILEFPRDELIEREPFGTPSIPRQ